MTEQAVDMEIPTETCTHDIKKMLVYFIERFGSYANFGLFVMVVSLWSFRFIVFLCKRDCFDNKNDI